MTDWLPSERGRLGWWAFVFALGVAAAYIAYSLVGMVVISVFGYYATRPIYRRLDDAIDSDGVAAGLTISLIVLPVVLFVLYTGFQIFQHVHSLLGGPAAGRCGRFSISGDFRTSTNGPSGLSCRTPRRSSGTPNRSSGR